MNASLTQRKAKAVDDAVPYAVPYTFTLFVCCVPVRVQPLVSLRRTLETLSPPKNPPASTTGGRLVVRV